ncbi:MAG TPA: hypothetical protein ENJ09_14390 [Planctomycetes bacterium]|nr:hypothetical protein [Planctomycetota bacterium]
MVPPIFPSAPRASALHVRGRLAIPPWLLASLAILTSFTLARLYIRAAPHPAAARRTTVDRGPEAEAPSYAGWRGEAEFRNGLRLHAALVPFAPIAAEGDLRSRDLGTRLGLGPGSLFRVVLWTEGDGDGEPAAGLPALARAGCSVGTDAGVLLRPVRELLPDSDAGPLARLLAEPGDAEAGLVTDPWQVALWGSLPRSAPSVLTLGSGEEAVRVPLEGERIPFDALPRSFRVRRGSESPSTGRVAELEARVAELEAKLREERLRHLAFVEGVARLNSIAPEPKEEPTEQEADEEESAPVDPRVEEIAAALRALLRVTGHRSLDLLNVGDLHEGWIGPVLFRILDDRGVLVGTLAAERLRMEASRAARTLSIVLEDGFEGRGGERTPFAGIEGGVRRITMDIDPDDFVARVPELFSPEDVDPIEDDGVWNLPELRRTLNRLLLADARAGWYRIHSFAGVLGSEIVSVHLEQYDASGHMQRRLFADRMRIETKRDEVVLVLDGGGTIRGAERTPFRDGRFVIHLVGADPAAWRREELPLDDRVGSLQQPGAQR